MSDLYGKLSRLALCLGLLGCENDFSENLDGFRCDAEKRCVAGYECDAARNLCVESSALGSKTASTLARTSDCDVASDADPCGDCSAPSSDPKNCDSCRTECKAPANGAAICEQGACGIRCNPGFSACDGTCVDMQINRAHCGACNAACNVGFACSAGACSVALQPGTTDSGGS